jgi:hypothetical protein
MNLRQKTASARKGFTPHYHDRAFTGHAVTLASSNVTATVEILEPKISPPR